jgi:LCP family protein required for cell wall assembly
MDGVRHRNQNMSMQRPVLRRDLERGLGLDQVRPSQPVAPAPTTEWATPVPRPLLPPVQSSPEPQEIESTPWSLIEDTTLDWAAEDPLQLGGDELDDTYYRRRSSNWRPTMPKAAAKSYFWWWFLIALLMSAAAVLGYGYMTRSVDQDPWQGMLSPIKQVASQVIGVSSPLPARMNILLLGYAGDERPGKYLTDTILVASIDTVNAKVALISIPRDLYVRIPTSQSSTKINALYTYGRTAGVETDWTKQAVEAVTGITIHHTITINFAGFATFVDSLGGINVEVKKTLHDERYPGPGYSYETFHLDAGWQHLDGATALKYVRERHADPDGDFGRAARQQQVLATIKDKVLQTFQNLDAELLGKLYDSYQGMIQTSIGASDYPALALLATKLSSKEVPTLVLSSLPPEPLLMGQSLSTRQGRASILIARDRSYQAVHQAVARLISGSYIQKPPLQATEESPTLTLVLPTTTKAENKLLTEALQAAYPKVQLTVVLDTDSSDLLADSTRRLHPYTLSWLADHTQLPIADGATADSDILVSLTPTTLKNTVKKLNEAPVAERDSPTPDFEEPLEPQNSDASSGINP